MPFLKRKQQSAAKFASSFAPKTAFGITFRNLVTRLMRRSRSWRISSSAANCATTSSSPTTGSSKRAVRRARFAPATLGHWPLWAEDAFASPRRSPLLSYGVTGDRLRPTSPFALLAASCAASASL